MAYFKNYSESRINEGGKNTQIVTENGTRCKFAIRFYEICHEFRLDVFPNDGIPVSCAMYDSSVSESLVACVLNMTDFFLDGR